MKKLLAVPSRQRQKNHPNRIAAYRPMLELLEARELLASDFGDAPLPYKTLLTEGGAQHVAIGPTLGATRDAEFDGVHSTGANGDDTAGIDDEDGVTFGTIRAGQLDATVTITVQGGMAKLDAWIDFNRDGSWGGPLEQIADTVAMVPGNNTISFDVPSWAVDGIVYARFRLSTTGNLGVGGLASDGEVEDHVVVVKTPKGTAGTFGERDVISASADDVAEVFAADIDSDGDMDVLAALSGADQIAWYENVGSQNFVAHTFSVESVVSIYPADVDGDGDVDILSATWSKGEIAWHENDGDENFTTHVLNSDTAMSALDIFAADLDADGDIDIIAAFNTKRKITWYENDGSENFTAHMVNSSPYATWDLFAADLETDGDMDLITANYGHSVVYGFTNDGVQNFDLDTIGGLSDPRSVFATDMDDDGDTDILTGSMQDGSVV